MKRNLDQIAPQGDEHEANKKLRSNTIFDYLKEDNAEGLTSYLDQYPDSINSIINEDGMDWTPVYFAVFRDANKCFKLLTEKLQLTSCFSLHVAALSGSNKVVDYLLNKDNINLEAPCIEMVPPFLVRKNG